MPVHDLHGQPCIHVFVLAGNTSSALLLVGPGHDIFSFNTFQALQGQPTRTNGQALHKSQLEMCATCYIHPCSFLLSTALAPPTNKSQHFQPRPQQPAYPSYRACCATLFIPSPPSVVLGFFLRKFNCESWNFVRKYSFM